MRVAFQVISIGKIFWFCHCFQIVILVFIVALYNVANAATRYELGTEYLGDVISVENSTENAENCSQICENEDGCTYFVFYGRDSKCALLTQVYGATTDFAYNVTSGLLSPTGRTIKL